MTKIKLNTVFPKVWGDLAFQNQWLRIGMILCLSVSVLSLCISAALVRRKPYVIAFDQTAAVVPLNAAPPVESEVDKAARRYVELRYVWRTETLASQLGRAKQFVASQSQKAFEKTINDLQIFCKNKSIAQRVYPTVINVDAKSNRVEILGDRFTEIQGLKAATLLRVTLTYQTGPRTDENPWGIYVIKEDEVQ